MPRPQSEVVEPHLHPKLAEDRRNMTKLALDHIDDQDYLDWIKEELGRIELQNYGSVSWSELEGLVRKLHQEFAMVPKTRAEALNAFYEAYAPETSLDFDSEYRPWTRAVEGVWMAGAEFEEVVRDWLLAFKDGV